MKYLLRKGGYYYRPNSAGYTEAITRAGIFDEPYALSHAKSCEEVTAIPVTEIEKEVVGELHRAIDVSTKILAAIADSVIHQRG